MVVLVWVCFAAVLVSGGASGLVVLGVCRVFGVYCCRCLPNYILVHGHALPSLSLSSLQICVDLSGCLPMLPNLT